MDHPPQPGTPPEGTLVDTVPPQGHRPDQDPQFRALRRSFRGSVFPVTAGFLLWYLLYVLLSGYAPGLMGARVAGNVNVALLLGLLQFASTFAIAAWYAGFAGRRLDPAAADLRRRRAHGTGEGA